MAFEYKTIRHISEPSSMEQLAASDLSPREVVIECLKLFRASIKWGSPTKERWYRLIDMELSRLGVLDEN